MDPRTPALSPTGGEGARRAGEGASRHNRLEMERFKCFTDDKLTKRDKMDLDIFWLNDETLAESANLPGPEIIAPEINDDLDAVSKQFAEIAEDLKR